MATTQLPAIGSTASIPAAPVPAPPTMVSRAYSGGQQGLSGAQYAMGTQTIQPTAAMSMRSVSPLRQATGNVGMPDVLNSSGNSGSALLAGGGGSGLVAGGSLGGVSRGGLSTMSVQTTLTPNNTPVMSTMPSLQSAALMGGMLIPGTLGNVPGTGRVPLASTRVL